MRFFRKSKSTVENTKEKSALSNSDSIEAIISTIEHEPFAISERNVLYAGLNELGGYYFFQTVIVGSFHTKTKKGAQLTVIGKEFKLQLDSDSMEFDSDPTDIKGRSITKIDFQIEEEDAAKMHKSTLSELQLTCKKEHIVFRIIESEEEE